MTDTPRQAFKPPNLIDRTINRTFGLFLKLGIGLSHNYLLEVRGRKTGTAYSIPVNVLEHKGRKYLVAPRGYTQWVRNVEASGEATLVRGAKRERVRLHAITGEEKAEILKTYLDRFKSTVQRYFPDYRRIACASVCVVDCTISSLRVDSI